MTKISGQNFLIATTTLVLLLTSTSAFGFRCGRKLVIENMHEAQVRRACGAPTSSRHLGYATRGSYIPVRRSISSGISTEHFPGYGHYTEEVELTEYVYNFGPRKFMQRLTFEAGILVKIETIGYGYHERKSK
jgi:uncharacterized protein DUF2845